MNRDLYPQVEQIDILQKELPPDYIYSEEWHRYQYVYMKKYIERIMEGWGIADFFKGISPDEIAVYAMTDFAGIVVSDLKRMGVDRIILSDGNSGKYADGHLGYKVLSAAELHKEYCGKKVKKVLVCSFFHANEIMQSLMDIGFDLSDIVTIKTVLENP